MADMLVPPTERSTPPREDGERLSLPSEPVKLERLARLSTQFEVHDQQQLEIRFNYSFGQSGEPQAYQADVYLFVPKNVGIHRGNYSRDEFYADVTPLLRLDADRIPLDKLADVRESASPLSRIHSALENLRAGHVPPTRTLTVHVKMFAFLFALGVRGEVRRLEKYLAQEKRIRKDSAKNPTQIREAIIALHLRIENELRISLARIAKALRTFRRMRADLWPFEEVSHHSLSDALLAADEYVSVNTEERLAQLSARIDEDPARFDGTGFVARAQRMLNAFAADEVVVRERYGYATLGSSKDRYAGEYFTYRTSLVKKSVRQALYLDARVSTRDRIVRNAVAGVAAGLAATWAVMTQLPGGVATLSWESRMLFTLAAVLAYVAKDRIKALTGEFLLARVRRYDHAAWLEGASLSEVGLAGLLVRIRESAEFLSSDRVPEEIRTLRSTRRVVRRSELGTEEVIHYRKLVDVGSSPDSLPLPQGYRVRDIMRINVRHFLVRLDDPLDQVRLFDRETARFQERTLPKVYHLNLIVRVQRVGADGKGHSRLQLLRVVLNKQGIVRVEEVVAKPPKELTVPPPKFPKRFARSK